MKKRSILRAAMRDSIARRSEARRKWRFESLEPRRLMAADLAMDEPPALLTTGDADESISALVSDFQVTSIESDEVEQPWLVPGFVECRIMNFVDDSEMVIALDDTGFDGHVDEGFDGNLEIQQVDLDSSKTDVLEEEPDEPPVSPIYWLFRGASDSPEVESFEKLEDDGVECVDADDVTKVSIEDDSAPHLVNYFGGTEDLTDRELSDIGTDEIFQTISLPTVTWSWRNDPLPQDVNGDQAVTALDILCLLDSLNEFGSQPTAELDALLQSLSDSISINKAHFDINGDTYVTPLDALFLVNYLNSGVDGSVLVDDTAMDESQAPQGIAVGEPTGQDSLVAPEIGRIFICPVDDSSLEAKRDGDELLVDNGEVLEEDDEVLVDGAPGFMRIRADWDESLLDTVDDRDTESADADWLDALAADVSSPLLVI